MHTIYHTRDRNSQIQQETETSSKMREYIHELLKANLPQYYNELGNRRSDEELRNYHDQYRWESRSDYLKINSRKNNDGFP